MPKSNTKQKSEHALIYVLNGKDESLVGAEAQKLLDELIDPEERATSLLDVDGPDVSLAEVLDELRTLPFLAEKRVVVIRKADDFISRDRNRQLLEKYFDSPCPTGILVLVVRSWPSNTKLARKLKKVGVLISVTQPKRHELPRRLCEYTRDAHDMNLNRDAAELLVDLAGDDLTRLYREIDKLSLFAEGAKSITPEHIEQLTGHNRMFGAFEVIDAILTGDPAGAADRLRRAGERGVHILAFHWQEDERSTFVPDIYARHRLVWLDRSALASYGRKEFMDYLNKVVSFEESWRREL